MEYWSIGVVEWWSGDESRWAEGYREGNHIAIRATDRYARLMGRSFVVFLLFIGAGCLFGQDQTSSKPKQFIYVLRLVARLYDEQAWSKEDQAAVEQHFNRLKEATDRGQVIFAGRTAESLDKTFGIVVFEAKDQQAASEFMSGDPAVVAGLMTAELHPFPCRWSARLPETPGRDDHPTTQSDSTELAEVLRRGHVSTAFPNL